MIAKYYTRASYKTVVQYVERNPSSELVLKQGVYGEKPHEIINELENQHLLNEGVKKTKCVHAMVSLSEEENTLFRSKQEEILKKYISALNLENTQVACFSHSDKNYHIHIIANRIDNDGKAIQLPNIYKMKHVANELSQKYNLVVAENVKKEAPRSYRIEKEDSNIQQKAQEIKSRAKDFQEYREELQKQGINIKIFGEKGLVYEKVGMREYEYETKKGNFTKKVPTKYNISASKLDKSLTLRELQDFFGSEENKKKLASISSRENQEAIIMISQKESRSFGQFTDKLNAKGIYLQKEENDEIIYKSANYTSSSEFSNLPGARKLEKEFLRGTNKEYFNSFKETIHSTLHQSSNMEDFKNNLEIFKIKTTEKIASTDKKMSLTFEKGNFNVKGSSIELSHNTVEKYFSIKEGNAERYSPSEEDKKLAKSIESYMNQKEKGITKSFSYCNNKQDLQEYLNRRGITMEESGGMSRFYYVVNNQKELVCNYETTAVTKTLKKPLKIDEKTLKKVGKFVGKSVARPLGLTGVVRATKILGATTGVGVVFNTIRLSQGVKKSLNPKKSETNKGQGYKI